MDETIKSLTETGKQFVRDPKNQAAMIAAGVVFMFTKKEEDKLRNAAIAGIAAELLLPDPDKKKDDKKNG